MGGAREQGRGPENEGRYNEEDADIGGNDEDGPGDAAPVEQPVNGLAFPVFRAAGRMRTVAHPTRVTCKTCAGEVVDRVYAPFRRPGIQERRFTVSVRMLVVWLIIFPLFSLLVSYWYQFEWPIIITWLSSLFEGLY